MKLAPSDNAFLEKLAKLAGLPAEHLLGVVTRDDRLVSLSLASYEGKALDVSMLDALTSLSVTGDRLTRVTLGRLAQLASVTVDDVKLAAIDVSGCRNLTKLDLSRCQLEKLPELPPRLEELLVADNPLARFAFRSKTLRQLDVTSCGLAALDVSRLAALTHLQCAFNAIRTLDLRMLEHLEVLWCQGNGAEVLLPPGAPLKTLVTSRNPRAELDTTMYPELETLFVGGCGLRTLVLGNPALEHLDCANNALSKLDLGAIPAVRHVEAQGNALGPIDVRSLARLETLEVDASVDVRCTELQKHVFPALRARFGLPKPTKTIAKMDLYQLHAFVDAYNWDDGPKRLLEVIRQPACVLATALLIYWQSEPQEFIEYATPKDAPKEERAWVELLREIETGVAKKRFPRGPLAFDVHDVHGVDLSDDAAAIPPRMREPVRPAR